MARPTLDVDISKLLELHEKGYTDMEIAKTAGVSRNTIIRRRKTLGLKANRRVGERGPSVKNNECYWMAVRRSLKYVGKYIIKAAREYYEKTHDWDTFFIAMVMEPRPMFHGVPGPFAPDPSKMNYKNTQYIMDFEASFDYVSLSGVPGPAILELARNYKSLTETECMRLAYDAVAGAGFVNASATVEDVEGKCANSKNTEEKAPTARICPVSEQTSWWQEQVSKALEWAPIKEWEPVKTAKNIFKRIAQQSRAAAKSASEHIRSGTGKTNRSGSIQSISTVMAYQGAMGY